MFQCQTHETMATTKSKKFELITLAGLFDNGNRSFTIPEYQRGYSWEHSQREDLRKDLTYLMQSDRDYKHYIGTVVGSKVETSDENLERYEVVDGQQRLTSIVLLLSCLYRKAAQNKGISDNDLKELRDKFI
jgi:uncharacterized protein with ParB-like and HNH nuclease domain